MDIVQSFYDGLAGEYDRLFADWQASTREQAGVLDRLFLENGFDRSARILDCACGIGTQAVGLAALGYDVTGSDISEAELAEAGRRAAENGVQLRLKRADFRNLEASFDGQFDIVIAMDNALPHMLTAEDLSAAVASMLSRLRPGGLFVASIRDYDSLLLTKPPYSPPYIHQTDSGQRISFQTWTWSGNRYRLIQYLIEDGERLDVSRFACEYRAFPRSELSELLLASGCSTALWRFPEDTGYYQPIVTAKKK